MLLPAPMMSLDPPATFTNPVGGLRMGDPFVARYGDAYHLTGTTDVGRGFRLWTSPNLVDWTPRGFAYERGNGAWGTRAFWAPELFEHAGRYHLAYSASNTAPGDGPAFRLCLAVADRPEGPYADLHTPWCDDGHPAIDAHVFVDADATPYLYYARVGQRREGTAKLLASIYAVRLKPDLSGPASEPTLCIAPEQPWEMPAEGRSHCNEGPFVLREGGRYSMTFSANHWGEPFYGIGYATAASPLGPWSKPADNPLVAADLEAGVSGPGHCSVTTSPDGRQRWIVYHVHADPTAPRGERTVNLDPLHVTADGRLVVDGPTRKPRPMP